MVRRSEPGGGGECCRVYESRSQNSRRERGSRTGGCFCSQVHAEDSPIRRTNSLTDVHLFYQRECGRHRKKTSHISTPEHDDQSDSHDHCT